VVNFFNQNGANIMSSREITREFRLAQWMQTIRERGESGETVNEFCERIGVSRDSYYYWQRIIRKAARNQLAELNSPKPGPMQTFTEARLFPGPSSAIISTIGQIRMEAAGFSLTADSSYPVENLAALIKAVARPC
jgi:hypothetical protein